jgi:hypothetical protein
MVHSGLFHADDHAFIAEVAKSGIIYLDVSWTIFKFISTGSLVKVREKRHKAYDNPIRRVL